jgi:2-C-methyl-D-erythritol 4-phosphate cytidylyltransferase
MGNPLPKQFIEVLGKPILFHTLDALRKVLQAEQIILVLGEDSRLSWQESKGPEIYKGVYSVAGGESRFHSVQNGLKTLQGFKGVITIHDAVRPLVDKATIEKTYQAAVKYKAAVACSEVTSSLRKIGNPGQAVDRQQYRLVQTPQSFHSEVLFKAYRQSYKPTFTDDASVVEEAGYPIALVEGNRQNIKITYPEDLILAEEFLGRHK